MKDIFNIYRMMLAESALMHEKSGKTALATALKQAQARLYNLLQLSENRHPVLAFVGLTNAGKSTLLSALFGARVAPTSNRPWSSVPVEYSYGREYEVSADFANTINSATSTFDSTEEMLDFVSSYATEGGREEAQMLYAKMPSDYLKNGLIIADTPGFGAAQAAGGGSHSESLREYLPRADYIFWVIKSLQGITRSELEFYNTFLVGKCDNIVVNCYDDYTEEEQQEFVKVNGKPLGERIHWHFVNARSALRGKMEQDEELIEESGISGFEHVIDELGPTDARLTFLQHSIIELFRKLAQYRKRHDENLFFVEHRRIALEHMLSSRPAGDPLVEAMYASIAMNHSKRKNYS